MRVALGPSAAGRPLFRSCRCEILRHGRVPAVRQSRLRRRGGKSPSARAGQDKWPSPTPVGPTGVGTKLGL